MHSSTDLLFSNSHLCMEHTTVAEQNHDSLYLFAKPSICKMNIIRPLTVKTGAFTMIALVKDARREKQNVMNSGVANRLKLNRETKRVRRVLQNPYKD